MGDAGGPGVGVRGAAGAAGATGVMVSSDSSSESESSVRIEKGLDAGVDGEVGMGGGVGIGRLGLANPLRSGNSSSRMSSSRGVVSLSKGVVKGS